MNTALIISWKAAIPGREQKALEFAADADEYWGKQASQGRCTSPEWFFLPTGGGIWMVKGDRKVLEDLVAADDSRRLLARGALLLEDWQYLLAEAGSGAEQFMKDYGTVGEQLGIM